MAYLRRRVFRARDARLALVRVLRADGVIASASRAAFIAVATKQRCVKHLLWRSVQAITAFCAFFVQILYVLQRPDD